MYDHSYVGEAGHAATILDAALISPDGSTLYLFTTANSTSGRTRGRSDRVQHGIMPTSAKVPAQFCERPFAAKVNRNPNTLIYVY